MAQTKGVCIVLHSEDGKYLMHFRDGRRNTSRPLVWQFFGGAIDDGESVFDAAVRELKEELSWDTTSADLEKVADNGTQVLIKCHKPIEWSDIVLGEGAGCGFFAKAELLRLPTPAYVQKFIKACL